MEDALAHGEVYLAANYTQVLILVVMEDALALRNVLQNQVHH